MCCVRQAIVCRRECCFRIRFRVAEARRMTWQRMGQWFKREFPDRNFHGPNATPASRLPVLGFRQPDNILVLVLNSGGMSASYRRSATARKITFFYFISSCPAPPPVPVQGPPYPDKSLYVPTLNLEGLVGPLTIDQPGMRDFPSLKPQECSREIYTQKWNGEKILVVWQIFRQFSVLISDYLECKIVFRLWSPSGC
ncbi:hypothetical protein T265_05031 [Opisthorchis viverrini]|uniref:Uncharacterized protein n=1 Tax=Opisthorchis viverrini TaxID=6198 RepID=A0A075AFS6_OPIVI|nr:hypothetical protein T265_05031 [Opisthorchis viverrini]KER28049.1 hypothetical protein T265_05031 [Opisthorchis viverrini]